MSDQHTQSVHPWRTREESYKETLKYLTGRLRGEITSIKTPWSRIDKIGAQGLEIHTSIAFCGRPGAGKSVILEQFCQELYHRNPGRKMRVLKFQLEMMSQVVDIREFSSVVGQSYSYMCNAEEGIVVDDYGNIIERKKLSKEDLIKCWEYVQRKTVKEENGEQKFPENIIEVSPNVDELEQIIDQYMEAYKIGIDADGKPIYTETIIGIDHARLIRRKGNQSETDMLYELGPMLNRKKKQYPIIIILLNHLKREINADARCENGKYGNFIRDEDVFGGDAIFQNFDIIVGIDRPSQRQITKYGPSNYIIEDTYVLVWHYLKVRNGETGMGFFRGEFHKMKIREIEVPPKAQQKLQTKQH